MKTKPESKHTPTPWHIAIPWGKDCAEAEANTAFILRAVNSHEALLKALKSTLEYFNDWEKDIPLEQKEIAQQVEIEIKNAITQAERK